MFIQLVKTRIESVFCENTHSGEENDCIIFCSIKDFMRNGWESAHDAQWSRVCVWCAVVKGLRMVRNGCGVARRAQCLRRCAQIWCADSQSLRTERREFLCADPQPLRMRRPVVIAHKYLFCADPQSLRMRRPPPIAHGAQPPNHCACAKGGGLRTARVQNYPLRTLQGAKCTFKIFDIIGCVPAA